MMHLHSPWWALLALPLTLAFIVRLVRRPPALLVPTVEPFAKGGAAGRALSLRHLPDLLYYLGGLALVVALMRPQFGVERTIRRAEGIDIILALDASGSMEAYDVPEGVKTQRELYNRIQSGNIKNRIEVAKDALRQFSDKRPNDRIGLIAFATLPFVACPPTLDRDFLHGHLEMLEAGTLGDHTGIAGPIASATSRLKESEAKRRVLVLFTDGANNVDDRITPEQAARIAGTFDIIIYTVGIGSDLAYRLVSHPFGGARLRRQGRDYNRELMKTISETTGGRFFEADDAASFNAVMAEIDDLETTGLEQPVFVDYSERFMPWLVAGLATILLAFTLENSVLQVLP
jgi:Ca-activated chloride channel family protein